MFNPIACIIGNVRRGDGGLFAAAGQGTWPFLVAKDRRWNARSIRRLLNQNGVDSWGYGQWAGEMYFRTAASKAQAAQGILEAVGVPVKGKSAPSTGNANVGRQAAAMGGQSWNPYHYIDNALGPINVIDQVDRLAGTIANGGSVQICLPRIHAGGEYTREDAVMLLDAAGIQTFGHLHDGSHIYFSVATNDVAMAAALLGIEVQT